MERLTLNILSMEELKQVVTDLLVSNEEFYNFSIYLANTTDINAGEIEPDDLAIFAGFLDDDATYYTAELLYMAQYAMDDVVE